MNFPTAKVSINTIKVSKTHISEIKQIMVKEADGEIFLVDEDCTNNQIDLEQCVIINNRYYPCAPVERDLSHYKQLFVDRSLKFAGIIKSDGFNLSESQQSFEFGDVTGYEILNYNDTYDTHVKNFLSSLPSNQLPEPYECIVKDFTTVKSIVPPNSLNFNKFKDAFKNIACGKENLETANTLKPIIAAQKKFKKPSEDLKSAFEIFNKSLQAFLEKFPKEIQEKCQDEKQHQEHIENKIKVLDLLNLRC